jgi:ribonuclease HI
MVRSLWQAMEEVWSLPNVKEMKSCDHEWLLHMLDRKTEVQRVMILMTLWRIWYCRNEVIHHKPAPSIEVSRHFLCSYLESILVIKQFPDADPTKGKSVVVWERKANTSGRKMDMKEKTVKKWKKPPYGYVKLNVDGSYCEADGIGGSGMILSDDAGHVIVSACNFQSSCRDPLEAEVVACKEGVEMVLKWSKLPCKVEMDCAVAVKLICAEGLDRSPYTGLVQEVKQLLSSRNNMEIVSISHEQNSVSHTLTNMGCSQARSQVWPMAGPFHVMALCQNDCNIAA